jgi:hypothetical protein
MGYTQTNMTTPRLGSQSDPKRDVFMPATR